MVAFDVEITEPVAYIPSLREGHRMGLSYASSASLIRPIARLDVVLARTGRDSANIWNDVAAGVAAQHIEEVVRGAILLNNKNNVLEWRRLGLRTPSKSRSG